MNKTMTTRLAALEGACGDGAGPFLILRQIIEPDGRERAPEAFIDGRGNSWRREAGEAVEVFRERAGAAALAMAGGGAARLVPVEG